MLRVLVLSLLLVGNGLGQTVDSAEFFERKVRPIFANRCQGCHGSRGGKAGLDLTSGTGFRRGADTGPVVIPKDWTNSRLAQVVSYQERLKMPPTGKLPDSEIAVLREWVSLGGEWPATPEEAAAPSQGPKKKEYSKALKEFWTFRPLRPVAPPAVRDESWVRSPIDRFLLAALEDKGLRPAEPTGKRTLIRRAAFDLTGLPASDQEVEEFLADNRPDAFAKVVDRLLASPRYGEKWGRHWLDVARYADSTGADEDYRYPHAWRYRDWVIEAFNNDMPFGQFVREQIAGDLLPPAAGQEVNTRAVVATGFLALGPKLVAEQDKVKMFYDIVDEQIDVTSKAFLGLTIACARCHDHKFDPISTKDYYSLASIFASTRQLEKIEGTVSQLYYVPLVGKAQAGEWSAYQKRVEDKKKEIDAVIASEGRRFRDQFAPQIATYMMAARRVYENGEDSAKVADTDRLDAQVLEAWVSYLKPGKERRAHLEPWYQAEGERQAEIAAQVQENFIAEAARRQKANDDWKAASENAKAQGQEPPPAPKFLAGDNRLFTEIGTGKGPLTLPEKDREKRYTAESRAKIAALEEQRKSIQASAPVEPPFACAVTEDKPIEQAVFLRGNPDSKGEIVPKRFPVILAGEQQAPITQGSGRRQLAEWLADPNNPLPARVMVNRIWQGHFGQGLVRTSNNFGITGERPTHPELLEWLAQEFLAHGGSVKHMHRLLMLSSAYRMSDLSTDLKNEKDPDNRLLSRFPMRRKTVEEIRDSLLLLDGGLDFTIGGTLQTGAGTDNEFSDGRKSLHPDNTRRRTVYLPLRRSNLATLLTLYDYGDATTSTEVREQTNVAPQALYMMNSKFVTERSTALAAQLLASETSDDRRIARAYLTVIGRGPAADEAAMARDYLSRFPGRPDNDEGRRMAWASLCRTLIASNDFIYIH